MMILRWCFRVVKYFQTISGRAPIKLDLDDTKYAMELWSYKIKMEKSDFKHNLTNRQGRVCKYLHLCMHPLMYLPTYVRSR